MVPVLDGRVGRAGFRAFAAFFGRDDLFAEVRRFAVFLADVFLPARRFARAAFIRPLLFPRLAAVDRDVRLAFFFRLVAIIPLPLPLTADVTRLYFAASI
jgi:hypothetical protein